MEIKGLVKIEDNNLLQRVIRMEVLKQQTRFNNSCVMIWNVYQFENKYFLISDEEEMFEMTKEQFNRFKDMTGGED